MLKEQPPGLTVSSKYTRRGPRRGYLPRNTLNNPDLLPLVGQRRCERKLNCAPGVRKQGLKVKKGGWLTTKEQKHWEAASLDSLDLLGDSSSFLSYQQPQTPDVVTLGSTPSLFGASTQAQQRLLARSLSIQSSTSKALDEFRRLLNDFSDSIESLSPTMDSKRDIMGSPYTPPKPKQDVGQSANVPAFGKPTSIHSPLVKDSSIFNVPKTQRPRPEHHRTGAKVEPLPQSQAPQSEFTMPQNAKVPKSFFHNSDDGDFDVIEIPRPANALPPMSYPGPPKMYSSLETLNSGFTSINAPKPNVPGAVIDIPDDAIFDKKFGAADPFQYIDTEKAHKNIKALLEGAFEDDEEVPRTRRRRKLKEKSEAVEAELSNTKPEESAEKASETDAPVADEGQDEEEEEEDDGTVEGLKVKLLPHQIDGVAWMRDREVTLKKRKGALPKGGLLADDVGPVLDDRTFGLLIILDGSRQDNSIYCIDTDESSTSSNRGYQEGRTEYFF